MSVSEAHTAGGALWTTPPAFSTDGAPDRNHRGQPGCPIGALEIDYIWGSDLRDFRGVCQACPGTDSVAESV